MQTDTCRTAGEQLWLRYGQRGVRGEAASGFPSLRYLALPALQTALQTALSERKKLEQAGLHALLHLMAGVQDTNLAACGGRAGQRFGSQYVAKLLSQEGGETHAALQKFDQDMIRRNLSPGSCADLLAMTYLLHFLQESAASF